MRLTEYNNYFKAFAAGDADLLHTEQKKTFYARNADQITSLLTQVQKGFVMLCMPYEKRPKTNKAESHVWIKQGALMILGKVKPGDDEGQILVQDTCEAIGDRLYKKMYYDRTKSLYGFDIASWSMEMIGPIVDNHFGYICLFEILDPIDLVPQ